MNAKAWMLGIVLCACAAGANASDKTRAGFDVLTWEVGARTAAMGGSGVALRGDLQALAHNPAALFGLADNHAVFGYQSRYADIQGGLFSVGRRFFGLHTALTLRYANYGEMRRTDALMNDLGGFTPGDVIVAATVSDSLALGLVWGVTGKAVFSNYDDYSASAGALDLGVAYAIPSQALRIGLSVANLGHTFDAFIRDKAPLPVTVRVGAAKRLAHLPLLFSATLIRYLDHESGHLGGFYWSLGGEFTLSPTFFLRWGYHSRGLEEKVIEGSSRMAGFSAGLGLLLSRLQVDIGYGLYGALGQVPTVTLGYRF